MTPAGLTAEELAIYNEAKRTLAIDADTLEVERRQYRVIAVGKRKHVVTPCNRREGSEQANYNDTGMALTAILTGKQTIDDYIIMKECMKPIHARRWQDIRNNYNKKWARKKRGGNNER